ncbi:unnamed protein product [Phytomonas sp. Hart1]|nr:unnamed protein product [Phytomonas sp. Hart1]|eukprot:CCW66505.1 unnamed protein product [Phytomonas sp. isolate Hart1]
MPPPNSQRTFFIEEDLIEISSEFDSGNIIQVERVGPFQYKLYSAMDCSNSMYQTNGRQWFHFSIRGGIKGTNVVVTVIGIIYSTMYTHTWAPVMAVFPSRPAYSRINSYTKVSPLKDMPPTPGFPKQLYLNPALRHLNFASGENSDSQGLAPCGDGEEVTSDPVMIATTENLGAQTLNCGTSSPSEVSNRALLDEKCEDATSSGPSPSNTTITNVSTTKKSSKRLFKKHVALTLEFEFQIEANIPLKSSYPLGHPKCPAIFIASNHPYSYTTLQRNIHAWQKQVAVVNRSIITPALELSPRQELPNIDVCSRIEEGDSFSSSKTVDYAKTVEKEFPVMNHVESFSTRGGKNAFQSQNIYFHREILCQTLEGRRVDLLTISGMSGAMLEEPRMALLSDEHGIPVSSAQSSTTRPIRFSGKRYVVLSARVHAGECPASHMMHGCIEYLLNSKDPRACALREHFVFFIVPMLNPDGVLRGHSRADAAGVDLNRTYRNRSFRRHPATFSLWALLRSLSEVPEQLALFVDMHAHSNQRGIFFYGNNIDTTSHFETLMYTQLVAFNSPYLEFKQCDFTESNMFATSRSGTCKNSSCRVALYTEAGVLHSYTIEASYVEGNVFTPVVALTNITGREDETLENESAGKLRYTVRSFNITGEAILLGLLDKHSLNPVSRLPHTMFRNFEGLKQWLSRQVKIELAERIFIIAHKEHGRGKPTELDSSPYVAILESMGAEGLPDKITLKGCRVLPSTTVTGVRRLLSIPELVLLLEQTPPSGPPRSLLHDINRSRFLSIKSGAHSRRVETTTPTTD